MPRNSLIKVRNGTEAAWASADPVLTIGEPGFSTDKGSFKIGDGVTSFSNLPDFYEGKLDNVTTVSKTKKSDFVCSNYANDAACIQAAINSAIASGYPEVFIKSGIYTITSPILITSDISIKCSPKTIFNWTTLTSGMIQCSGTLAATVLGTADILQGATSVTVADVTGVVPGDLVVVFDNTIWNTVDPGYENHKTGEMHEVSSVDGGTNTITFYEGTLHAYTTANSLSVDIIHPIKVELSNLIISGISGTAAYRFIQLTYCKDSFIHDCTLDKGGDWGIWIDNCHNISTYRNRITHAEKSGMGYGVAAVNACAHIKVYENNMSACRHCFTSGGSYIKGQCRDLQVYNNEFYASIIQTMQPIDAHQIVESIYAHHNIIHLTSQYAFCTGAKISKFSDNKVYGGHGTSVRGNLLDMEIVIENNEYYNCSIVFTDDPDAESYANTEKLLKVTNNILINSGGDFVLAKRASTVEITGNRVDTTTNYWGVYLENATSGIISQNHFSNIWRGGVYLKTCSNLRVSENVLTNCCQYDHSGELYEASIGLSSCYAITVNNNTINDTTGKSRYGIREYETSSSNKILCNTVSGAITAQISKLGASTIVKDNPGYNPVGSFTAPTLPASAEIYTNSYGYSCLVLITGGTVTGISLGGTPTGLTSGMFTVPSGTTIAITYSAAPTWKWWGL